MLRDPSLLPLLHTVLQMDMQHLRSSRVHTGDTLSMSHRGVGSQAVWVMGQVSGLDLSLAMLPVLQSRLWLSNELLHKVWYFRILENQYFAGGISVVTVVSLLLLFTLILWEIAGVVVVKTSLVLDWRTSCSPALSCFLETMGMETVSDFFSFFFFALLHFFSITGIHTLILSLISGPHLLFVQLWEGWMLAIGECLWLALPMMLFVTGRRVCIASTIL